MKPLFEQVTSVSIPLEPVDVERLDAVFARIRFKMLDPAAARSGIPKPLLDQMRRVARLIDDIRRDFKSIEGSVLSDRLKKFEVRIMADLTDKLSLLVENIGARPLSPADLPKSLADRFIGPGNLYIIRVFPAGDVWDPQFLDKFVRDLRSVDPDATGDP